ncbi:MAG TPA: DUF2865 domain-containing protein [Hyphomicrobiaceae bacterium]|jgi:hypothetical protein|nr:DUF2865 domain-containing protein [Hyphomicrobiaceae bacterium]
MLRTSRILLLVLSLVPAIALVSAGAMAQGWSWWPFGQDPEPQPVPREPVYRPQPGTQPIPPGAPGAPMPARPGQPLPPGAAGPLPYASRPGVNNICVQLEQRLVAETQGGASREALPKLEADIRQLEQSYRVAQAQLNRADCWEQFLFSKTLRRTRQCLQLNNQVESMRYRLAELDAQRQQIVGQRDRSYQDEIIRELARNGCGPQYSQEARRRDNANNPFAMLFGSDEDDGPRSPANRFGNLPFATYRTLCVRLCDGYYFPVSFSTLPNHFQRDADMCQSHCAAPAELYYHQNPGGAVDQMVSVTTQQPYTSLKSAWRYRKEYVPGCSCKQAEYKPEMLEKKADTTPAPAAATPTRKADATSAPAAAPARTIH